MPLSSFLFFIQASCRQSTRKCIRQPRLWRILPSRNCGVYLNSCQPRLRRLPQLSPQQRLRARRHSSYHSPSAGSVPTNANPRAGSVPTNANPRAPKVVTATTVAHCHDCGYVPTGRHPRQHLATTVSMRLGGIWAWARRHLIWLSFHFH